MDHDSLPRVLYASTTNPWPDYTPAIETCLVSRRASMPSLPSSRPRPLCLIPPNGHWLVDGAPSFTPMVPAGRGFVGNGLRADLDGVLGYRRLFLGSGRITFVRSLGFRGSRFPFRRLRHHARRRRQQTEKSRQTQQETLFHRMLPLAKCDGSQATDPAGLYVAPHEESKEGVAPRSHAQSPTVTIHEGRAAFDQGVMAIACLCFPKCSLALSIVRNDVRCLAFVTSHH